MSSRGMERALQKAREQERMRQQGQAVPVKPRRTLSTDPERMLTPTMWDALWHADRDGGFPAFEYGAGIVGGLKAAGLIRRDDGYPRHYRTTEAGKRRLSERSGR